MAGLADVVKSNPEVKTPPEILASINNLKMAKGSGDYSKEKMAFDEFKIALKKEHAKKEIQYEKDLLKKEQDFMKVRKELDSMRTMEHAKSKRSEAAKAGNKGEVRYWDAIILEKNPTAYEIMHDPAKVHKRNLGKHLKYDDISQEDALAGMEGVDFMKARGERHSMKSADHAMNERAKAAKSGDMDGVRYWDGIILEKNPTAYEIMHDPDKMHRRGVQGQVDYNSLDWYDSFASMENEVDTPGHAYNAGVYTKGDYKNALQANHHGKGQGENGSKKSLDLWDSMKDDLIESGIMTEDDWNAGRNRISGKNFVEQANLSLADINEMRNEVATLRGQKVSDLEILVMLEKGHRIGKKTFKLTDSQIRMIIGQDVYMRLKQARDSSSGTSSGRGNKTWKDMLSGSGGR